MLFRQEVLDQIASGIVTLAFRRWTKPTVKAGGRLRTAVGVLKILAVDEIEDAQITPADALRAGFATTEALRAQLDQRTMGHLYRIAFQWDSPDPRTALRDSDQLDPEEMSAILAQLDAMDQRSPSGAWTRPALQHIAEKEGRTAGELAHHLNLEKPKVKLLIRKLKELGLTESLASGYRISKRGARALAAGRSV